MGPRYDINTFEIERRIWDKYPTNNVIIKRIMHVSKHKNGQVERDGESSHNRPTVYNQSITITISQTTKLKELVFPS